MAQSTIYSVMIHHVGSQKGSTSGSLATEDSRRIREWLLGILRFTVTLEQCDRTAAMCLAAEMDRLGAATTQSGFNYFTRTSAKLCDCIAGKRDIDKLTELRLHIHRIDDHRFRRAFEGVLFENHSGLVRSRKLDRQYLWKGLAART